uniref:Uncharacterized protein LOC109505085 n=1 Tax=Elaeis guineensis var. tenera TaxID=51953 RepID=A0A6J0PCC4_ELAGV|nr:uncharacterized protein LOC109505085 [Elaeis guineensis]
MGMTRRMLKAKKDAGEERNSQEEGGIEETSKQSEIPEGGRWKYYDKVWCDVVAMDACHLLFGRPWQYDCSVIHDGYWNTYTFWKDNQKITLVPMKEEDLSKPKAKTSINILTKHTCLKEAMEADYLLAMVEKGESAEHDIPPLVHPILQKFAYVFSKDLPIGLPLERDIQHHIDHIPGASLSNKPTYYMSPTEHEDLQR